MLSYNLDFNSCAIRDGFRKSSHILISQLLVGFSLTVVMVLHIISCPIGIRKSFYTSTLECPQAHAYTHQVKHVHAHATTISISTIVLAN